MWLQGKDEVKSKTLKIFSYGMKDLKACPTHHFCQMKRFLRSLEHCSRTSSQARQGRACHKTKHETTKQNSRMLITFIKNTKCFRSFTCRSTTRRKCSKEKNPHLVQRNQTMLLQSRCQSLCELMTAMCFSSSLFLERSFWAFLSIVWLPCGGKNHLFFFHSKIFGETVVKELI